MVAFGRVASFDPRSREWPIRALLAPEAPLRTRLWPCDLWLDQGVEGACVGFAWAHELAAEPVAVPGVDDTLARALYQRAKQLDEWEGDNYDGTSVLAGAKATAERGFLIEYRWAFGIDDVLATLSQHGPVVFGLNWYQGMVEVTDGCRVRPTGRVVGGHAIVGIGVDVDAEVVVLHNSWGLDWGRHGRACIAFDDLDRLLREDGEACVPVVRAAGWPPPAGEDTAATVEAPGCLPRGLARLIAR